MLKNWRKQAGFTLMELMVVIVIVAILAAVAVPLYINYVKDAQRTEAKGAIGAVITAEQVYYQQNPLANSYTDLATLKAKGLVDITEVEIKWTVTAVPGATPPGFTISATNIADPTVAVYYRYNRAGTSEWSNTVFP